MWKFTARQVRIQLKRHAGKKTWKTRNRYFAPRYAGKETWIYLNRLSCCKNRMVENLPHFFRTFFLETTSNLPPIFRAFSVPSYLYILEVDLRTPSLTTDYAREKYDRDFVDDVKLLLAVLFMYLPLPVFWALFDQQVRFTPVIHRKKGLSLSKPCNHPGL